MSRPVTQCPVCDSPLRVTELTCVACETRLHGIFPAPPLARLPREHQTFVETFVRCRGVLRDMERELGVSYPTVRARLDAAVAALESILAGDSPAGETPVDRETKFRDERRKAVLRAVEDGTLDPLDAAEALRRL